MMGFGSDLASASDLEMREAVERWVRATGRWGTMGPCVRGSPLVFEDGSWCVPEQAVLVWVLVLEARPLRDGSACKRCRGRGMWSWWTNQRLGWPYWVAARTGPPAASGAVVARESVHCPWSVDTELQWDRCDIDPEFYWLGTITGPCPDCDGTGLADLTDAYAQHVLDAQPRVEGNPAVYAWTEPGDHASIDALHMLADRLQGWECASCYRAVASSIECHWCRGRTRPSPHPALGIAIAHLLAGKREGTAAAVERLQASVAPDDAPDYTYTITASDLPTITVTTSSRRTVDIASELAARWNASALHDSNAPARVVGDRVVLDFADAQEVTVAVGQHGGVGVAARPPAAPTRIGSKAARRRF